MVEDGKNALGLWLMLDLDEAFNVLSNRSNITAKDTFEEFDASPGWQSFNFGLQQLADGESEANEGMRARWRLRS